MIPLAFDYEVAESVDHAIELLGQHGDEAKLLAGGHSLLPIMKLRLAAPAVLVDLGRLSDLNYVRDEGDTLAIGAMTRHCDMERDPTLHEHCGLVAYTASLVGDPQVRHRGTIGGSVSHGDAASDLPSALLALDATFVVRGPNGERTLAAGDFFQDYLETALEPDEVLTEIRVPKLNGAGWSYRKFNRRAQDWAVVGVAAVVERSNGSIGSARIGLTNMGSTPVRATAAESALAGADPSS
ncbi:MAG: xanthine dehydrogenase family protein subunit M, partial [Actinomycetota bacterium]|nr:xanthine dehydrogenase family protein subunit M [Actinomycetota bacterium]